MCPCRYASLQQLHLAQPMHNGRAKGKDTSILTRSTSSELQVQRELVSGAVETEFLHTGYTNLYNNITNIILVVSPTAALHEKSVLVNAHFDSTLGTTGYILYSEIYT